MKKVLFLVAPIIAALCVFSVVKQLVNNSVVKDAIVENPPPLYKCYEAGPVGISEPNVGELEDQLEQLDTLYADKKIDQTTYKIRKVDLLKKIKESSK